MATGQSVEQSVEQYFHNSICQIQTTQAPNTIRNPHLEANGEVHETRGSGFLIDSADIRDVEDAFVIVTNFHVVCRAVSIRVRFAANSPEDVIIPARALSVNPQFDLALLVLDRTVDPEGTFPAFCSSIPLGDSTTIRSNTELLALVSH